MISEWFMSLWQGLFGWSMGLIPPDALGEDFVGTVVPMLRGLVTNAANLGAWVPWAVVIGSAGVTTSTWAVLALIKLVRWVLGLIPTMGGG